MFLESTLWAAGTAQTAPSGPQAAFGGIMPLLLIFVIFYFLLIRPQQKQVKKHKQMLSSLKKGDNVITSGGLIGTIAEMKDNEITLKIADNCKAKFTKSSVSALIGNGQK